MEDDVLLAASAVVVLAGQLIVSKRRKRRKRWLVRSFLAKRSTEGAYGSLMNDLRLQSGYENFVRMTFSDFEDLLQLIAPFIIKEQTTPNVLSPGEQLATTLRFLATGDSYGSLMYQHRISKSSISKFIPHVCKMIVQTLHKELKVREIKYRTFEF